MAITANMETSFGETRELYIRINNIEASNHGQPATALARGFLSRDAFESGKSFVLEIPFSYSADVSMSLWTQAYAELKRQIGAPSVDC